MTQLNTLTRVLEVACLTEDRSPDEQRAMLDLALHVDKERGAFMTSNNDLAPPTLVAHVEATYDPSTGRMISLTAAQRQQYNRLCARWDRCDLCGWPQGMHYGNEHGPSNCPPPDDWFRRFRGDALDVWRGIGTANHWSDWLVSGRSPR